MICGIDPSISCTGLVIGEINTCEFEHWALRSTPPRRHVKAEGRVHARIARMDSQIGRIVELLRERPILSIWLEGYAFGARTQGHHDSVEFGGMLRWTLAELFQSTPMYEVAPTALKKWTTGRGKADKDQMARAVARKWDVTFATSDECDAFALYQYGLARLT